jgi:hypothetical protein
MSQMIDHINGIFATDVTIRHDIIYVSNSQIELQCYPNIGDLACLDPTRPRICPGNLGTKLATLTNI